MSDENQFQSHPLYCSCCPGHPQIVAQKLVNEQNEILEIQKRIHGSTHYGYYILDSDDDDEVD